ncbi:MAG: hypothetical protein ACRD1E_04405, partial [Terriglobales bacterium]
AGLLWMLVDLARGANATARIETAHSSLQAPLAARWRQAERVLMELQMRLPARAGTEPQPLEEQAL